MIARQRKDMTVEQKIEESLLDQLERSNIATIC